MKTSINNYKSIYFLGIGGIGMSALARYFNLKGLKVGGYDKTPSPLTVALEKEGIDIHYEDLGSELPDDFKNVETTLVVYTPAIPKELKEFVYVQSAGYEVLKRAQVLGLITRSSLGLGIAGTHGKTTTSTMLTHLLNDSHVKCNAFLGGISANFNSNFVASETSQYTVIEADEFDRSFLQLSPFAAIITSTDADHLDIYGDAATFYEGFQAYANLISPDGILIKHASVKVTALAPVLTYGIDCTADYVGSNLRYQNGFFHLDVKTPSGILKDVELGLPGIHNAENAIANIALCQFLGLSEAEIRHGLKTFKGVKRRFEYYIKSQKITYIDDYAHHPTEIKALIQSVRLLYPDQKITGIFQPHLFSRTRDFMQDFANELSKLDELILLPIYPARELPIEGITSDALLEMCSVMNKKVLSPEAVIELIGQRSEGVILTIGAGDIDRIVPVLNEKLMKTLNANS